VFILMSGIYIIRKGEPYLKWLSIISLIGALSLALIFNVNKLNEKLFSANTTTENMSKYDRLQSFDAGEKIFMEYPVLGLGLEAYGFLVNDKIEQDDFIFYNYDFRRIPNNVYIEILSQLGLIGCMLFCFIFYKIMKPLYNVSLELFLGVIGILVYWIAFPTFSVAYIWAYLGFCTLITNIQTDRYLTPSVGGLRDHL